MLCWCRGSARDVAPARFLFPNLPAIGWAPGQNRYRRRIPTSLRKLPQIPFFKRNGCRGSVRVDQTFTRYPVPFLSVERADELRWRVVNGERKATLAREFAISRETLYQYLRN